MYINRITLHWFNGQCGLGEAGGLEASPSNINRFIWFEYVNRVSVYRFNTYRLFNLISWPARFYLNITGLFFFTAMLIFIQIFTFTQVCWIINVWIWKMRGGDLLPVMHSNYVHVLVIKLYIWYSHLRLQRESIIFLSVYKSPYFWLIKIPIKILLIYESYMYLFQKTC